MLQPLLRLSLTSALVFSQISLLHHIMLPYLYAAGCVFLDKAANVNKCFTDFSLSISCLALIVCVGLRAEGTQSISWGFFVRKGTGVCRAELTDWTKEYRANRAFKICSRRSTHERKPERVQFTLWGTEPSLVFSLPQAARLFIMHVSYCHHITLLITEDGYSLSRII